MLLISDLNTRGTNVPIENLSQMHRQVAGRLGSRVALHFQRGDTSSVLSWEDYRVEIDRVAAGLLALGIQAGDRIGLLAENRVEWLVSDLAMLALGTVTVPLHATLSAEQVGYQLRHSGTRGVIVSHQVQADKLAAIISSLEKLEWVISFDAVKLPSQVRQIDWRELGEQGQSALELDPNLVLNQESQLSRDHLATIIYTSGTTGEPKGVMLSHGNLITNAEAVARVMPSSADDLLLSWLPYSHIYARTVDHYLTIYDGVTIAIAESMDTLADSLQQYQPTWMTAVPRFYEKSWSAVAHLAEADRSRELKKFFGSRLRRLSSGGAPLSPDLCRGFHQAGIPIYEGYGLTESSPVISFNYENHWRIGSVGLAIPGVEVKIAADGEILTRGPHVMQGYWDNPQATAQTMSDGWLATGDVGHLDPEGYLYITNRKKDLIITSSGKNISPSYLERLLIAGPYIEQAIVFGDNRQFLTAILTPNLERLDQLAKELDCPVDTDTEWIMSAEIYKFFALQVEQSLKEVSCSEQIRGFLIRRQPFAVEADELTASLKIRRRFIVDKYRDHFEALYQD